MIPIPNTATQAAYVDATTFRGDEITGGFVVIANNSAFLKLFAGKLGQETDLPEFLVPPSIVSLAQVLHGRPIAGVAVRDAVAGTHAQVFGCLFQRADPSIAGQLFSGSVAASGGFTPGVSITSQQTQLTGDVAIPATSVWTDILSLSLAKGTWDVLSVLTCVGSGGGVSTLQIRIFDGTTSWAASQSNEASAASNNFSLAVVSTVTLAATTTVKIQGFVGNFAVTIKAQTAGLAANIASTMRAIQLA